jgi:phospholipase/carboxylesterase
MSKIPSLSGPSLKPKSGTAKQLIVLLHGLGADGNDLFGLAPELAPHFPDAHFISPNAPFACDMAPYGYQWFSMLDRDPAKLYAGILTAAPILNTFLDTQLASLNLDDSKLALIGFSQGSMMSLHVAPRRAKAIAGVVGFSGGVIGGDMLGNDIRSKPPVCLIHGDADPVVPYSLMKASEIVLSSLGVPVETHTRPGLPHGIDGGGMQATVAFLKKVLK